MVFSIGCIHVKGREWKDRKGRSRELTSKGRDGIMGGRKEGERKAGEGEGREGRSLP